MAQGSGNGLGLLIAGKIICCGGLALVATGAFSGFGAWLTAGGYVWTGAAVGALFVGLALLIRRRGRADVRDDEDAASGRPVRSVP
jgi:hypothetical protein